MAIDISQATYDSESVAISETDSRGGVTLKPDGTKMYITSVGDDDIYQYTLSTAWDVSTATYDSKKKDVLSAGEQPSGVAFKPDGTKMYISSLTDQNIYQWTLSTAWDVSTATYDSVSLSVSSNAAFPQGVRLKDDGTSLYVISRDDDVIAQYDMSTAYDLSTASYASKSLDISSQGGQGHGHTFSSDGTQVFFVDRTNERVYQYTLSTAWDISSASYDSKSLDVSSEVDIVYSIFLKDDDTKIYVLSDEGSTSAVYAYDIPAAAAGANNILFNFGGI